MSLDLKKLANKLEEALSNETSETLTKFLTDKRMNNNKQSSVEFLTMQLIKNGIITNDDLRQAKAMHKEEVTSFTADWSIQYKYENGKNINQFYNETFGGNNEQQ